VKVLEKSLNLILTSGQEPWIYCLSTDSLAIVVLIYCSLLCVVIVHHLIQCSSSIIVS